MTDRNTADELSPIMEIPETCRHYGGRSRSWIHSAVENGDLPAPVKIGGKKMLFSGKAILARDAEREAQAAREQQARLAERAVA